MQPHQQRVIDEKEQLEERWVKLQRFIATDTFGQLDAAEQGRLVRQGQFMTGYLEVLRERIAAF